MNATIRLSLAVLAAVTLAALLGPALLPHSPQAVSPRTFQPPDATHWLGTDLNGRDVLARVLSGARVSLALGALGASVSLVIGTLYGLLSGYAGGRTDLFLMRVVDILYSLPRIILVLVLVAVFDGHLKNAFAAAGLDAWAARSRLVLVFVGLGGVSWLTLARIVRGQVLSLKERDFIRAAQALGQSPGRIMIHHLLPNLRGLVIVYLTLTIPAVILEESFLSFLGLGVQAPQASWGTLLADGAAALNPVKIYWWLLLAPAAFMAATLLALNFLGDALRDYYDPRNRG
jgi:oligopeptide transport system permease protein